jgi:hypothetical protein
LNGKTAAWKENGARKTPWDLSKESTLNLPAGLLTRLLVRPANAKRRIILLSANFAGKENLMLQQITIQTPDAKRLKPLIKSAIQRQLDDFEDGIRLTRESLEAFERKYNMSTAEFLRRFKPGDLEETLDFIQWQGETKMLALLEDKRAALKEARLK